MTNIVPAIDQLTAEPRDWWLDVEFLTANNIINTEPLTRERDPDEGLAFLLDYDGRRIDIGTITDGYPSPVYHSATNPNEKFHSIQLEETEPVVQKTLKDWITWYHHGKCYHNYQSIINIRC